MAQSRSSSRLSLQVDPECSEPDGLSTLLEALQTRLPGLVVERSAAATGLPSLAWRHVPDVGCVLFLRHSGPAENEAPEERLPLEPTASEADLRAAAIRLAWWIEVPTADAPTSHDDEQDAEHTTAESDPAADVPAPSEPAAVEEPTSGLRFAVATQFGASVYPTPSNTAGVVRLVLSLGFGEHVWLGFEGRLATELGIGSNMAPDVDVYDRSVGLVGRYTDRLADRWLLDLSLGLRYALPQIDVDVPTGGEIDEPASNLMVFTGVGGGLRLTSALWLRADVLGAIAVANRRVVYAGGGVAELGVFNLDLLLGFELLF